MILDLFPCFDLCTTEWMAQMGYESAERVKHPGQFAKMRKLKKPKETRDPGR